MRVLKYGLAMVALSGCVSVQPEQAAVMNDFDLCRCATDSRPARVSAQSVCYAEVSRRGSTCDWNFWGMYWAQQQAQAWGMVGTGAMLMQQPPAPPTTRCTTTYSGSIAHTTCR
jgi:hypothetical protein